MWIGICLRFQCHVRCVICAIWNWLANFGKFQSISDASTAITISGKIVKPNMCTFIDDRAKNERKWKKTTISSETLFFIIIHRTKCVHTTHCKMCDARLLKQQTQQAKAAKKKVEKKSRKTKNRVNISNSENQFKKRRGGNSGSDRRKKKQSLSSRCIYVRLCMLHVVQYM